MRLLLKQKMFSLLDSYDIYDENGQKAYTVKVILPLATACTYMTLWGMNRPI